MEPEFTLVSSRKKNKTNSNQQQPIIQQQLIIQQNPEINEDNQNKYDNAEIQKEKKVLTQEEMVDRLISKIETYTNVDIKTKKIEKETGMFYAINLRIDLSDIGSGVFHSAKLNTVSHINRIVNIKLIFSDNEILHEDMKINSDALIQCFREIAPNTITNIKIDTFKDQLENEHLCLTISTVKTSSLTYIYDKTIEYVNVINEKYGEIQKTTHQYKKYNTMNHYETNETLDEEPIINVESIIKEEPIINVEPIIKVESVKDTIKTFEDNETLNNKLIINNSIKTIVDELTKQEKRLLVYLGNVKHAQIIILENKSSEHIVKELNKEEKRLELEIENTRKLLKAQTYVLENTVFNKDTLINEKPISEKPISEKPISEKPINEKPINEKPINEKPISKKNSKTSFADKVAYGNN